MPPAVRAAPAVITIAAVAAGAALLEPNAYPSYDYAFTMASAQDVLAGRGTGYEVPVFSPVPHPLTLLVALVVVPLGDAAFPVFTALALLAFGLLCWSLFRIGNSIVSWQVGLLAAAVVFTSPAIFELAARTYGDIAFAALIAAALALEVRRPRRGRPVMALLVLAGLVRPEAWLLAGGYWLYLAPRRPWRDRLALAALAAVAPIAWMAMDTALTGDPFHSVEVTRVYTEKAQASVSAGKLWDAGEALLGWPVLVGALGGVLVARRHVRTMMVPPLLVGTAAFVATVGPAVLGESPVLRRYLVLPATSVALFFAVACLGWVGLRPRSQIWRLGGIALLVATVVLVAGDRADRWHAHRTAQAERVELLEHLRGWAIAPPVRRYLTEPACQPLLTPGYGYRPYLRYWLDVAPRAVAFHFADTSPAGGTVLLPTAADGYQEVMLAEVGRRARRRVLRDAEFRAMFREVARSPRWELYAAPRCRRAAGRRITRQGP